MNSSERDRVLLALLRPHLHQAKHLRQAPGIEPYRRGHPRLPRRTRIRRLAVPGSDQVILGACLARLVCCVDRGQAAGDGRYPGPQFGGLDDLDFRAEPQELGLSVLG